MHGARASAVAVAVTVARIRIRLRQPMAMPAVRRRQHGWCLRRALRPGCARSTRRQVLSSCWSDPSRASPTDELEDATGAGLRPVSLGPRVLRTETAGLAAIAVLQAMFGDL